MSSETASPPHTTSLEYVVRTGVMRTLSVMQAGRGFGYGDRVVTRTERGTEFGVVLCEATPAALEQLEEPVAGKVLRAMSGDDETQWPRCCPSTTSLTSTRTCRPTT